MNKNVERSKRVAAMFMIWLAYVKRGLIKEEVTPVEIIAKMTRRKESTVSLWIRKGFPIKAALSLYDACGKVVDPSVIGDLCTGDERQIATEYCTRLSEEEDI